MTTARMPMSVASRRGISGVAAQAESEPLVLTSHGRAVAFLESGAHREQSALLLRNAAAAVIDAAADLVAGRVERSTRDETCERLGIDPARIRARSAKGSGADQ